MYYLLCTATSRKVRRRWWRIWPTTATPRRLQMRVRRPAYRRRRRRWKRPAAWSRSAPMCHVDRRRCATTTRTALLVKRSFVRRRSRPWSRRRTSTASAGRLVIQSPSTQSGVRVSACVKHWFICREIAFFGRTRQNNKRRTRQYTRTFRGCVTEHAVEDCAASQENIITKE